MLTFTDVLIKAGIDPKKVKLLSKKFGMNAN